MELKDKIKELRKSKRMTQAELAKKLGIAVTSVSSWERGANKPLMDKIEIMSILFDVPISYFFNDLPTNITPLTNVSKIPILGEIACGEPILAEENIEGYMDEVAELLPTGTLFYLHCKGDSMEPTIRNGSYVLVRQQPEVEDGEIAAVLVNGNTEATLKRVKHQGNIIMLMPDNPAYSPYIITEDNPARIIGRALEVKFKL